jgi:hypothetical protein
MQARIIKRMACPFIDSKPVNLKTFKLKFGGIEEDRTDTEACKNRESLVF